MRSSETQARYVTEAQMNRLADWSRRKPVIALMGEFSAGKSTLMNLLIGQNILPTQVTATQMPPVWIRYGSGAPSLVDHAGKHHPVNLADRASIPVNRTRYIRLYCEADILKHCDLIDTPGISDPNIPVENWIRTIGYANAVMWCTHAAQAWRESERGAWEALPERLRQTSILLVTRKDKITSELDRMKIGRRLERETQTLFTERMFISLTNAIRARQAGDSGGWAESGAQEFSEMLARIVEGISARRSSLLERYVPGSTDAKPQGIDCATALVPDTAMPEEGLGGAYSDGDSSGEPGVAADLHQETATPDLQGPDLARSQQDAHALRLADDLVRSGHDLGNRVDREVRPTA